MARSFDAEASRGLNYHETSERSGERRPSLSKAMQNVLSMINNGLHSFKNRRKAQ